MRQYVVHFLEYARSLFILKGEEDLDMSWGTFRIRIFLEDSYNTSDNEMMYYVKSFMKNKTLKEEIEALVYADYLNLGKSYKESKSYIVIDKEEDIWRLLGSVNIAVDIVNLSIGNDKRVYVQFFHRIYGCNISICGIVGHLTLKLVDFH